MNGEMGNGEMANGEMANGEIANSPAPGEDLSNGDMRPRRAPGMPKIKHAKNHALGHSIIKQCRHQFSHSNDLE